MFKNKIIKIFKYIKQNAFVILLFFFKVILHLLLILILYILCECTLTLNG